MPTLRSHRVWLCIAGLALAALTMVAEAAAEFRSVGPAPAIMFDAPGQRARKLFIAPPGMPLEIVLANGDWVRVRDAAGELAWIEARALVPRRMLVVEATQASIRTAANDAAPVVFTAGKGVLLELAEPIASGWIKVRHRDGESGFVRASEVWGE